MPRAPKKCGTTDCETRVTGRRYCPPCETAQQNRSGWGRGSTRQTRATRQQVLTAWPTCYLNYPGCTITSTEDDHVIPVSQGGSDDLANRRGACHHCHRIKSQAEATAGRHPTAQKAAP